MSTADACPECGGRLEEIVIIDRGDSDRHHRLEYTVPEARRSFWTGNFPIEGSVIAYMCDSCGRILLYGKPRQQ